ARAASPRDAALDLFSWAIAQTPIRSANFASESFRSKRFTSHSLKWTDAMAPGQRYAGARCAAAVHLCDMAPRRRAAMPRREGEASLIDWSVRCRQSLRP